MQFISAQKLTSAQRRHNDGKRLLQGEDCKLGSALHQHASYNVRKTLIAEIQ
ncbi:hypothetical protein T12_15838 [Trichinella patagoniensis]|uniref:Uncharacterized protein n=1 Tax=Trichinella patagoniensis TaxID=990121 RepID=A0A0V0YWK4_9BILA|nr:hypothetical protein T12_15838 [Trichinella patagoniensis]